MSIVFIQLSVFRHRGRRDYHEKRQTTRIWWSSSCVQNGATS
ncbi:hypothetical protein C6341_g6929 [Phytophthora cactorum]|nr:hypothetical protein C6341_g6929 [Phytophthora cactorum]